MIASFFDLNGQTVKNAPFGTRVHKCVTMLFDDSAQMHWHC